VLHSPKPAVSPLATEKIPHVQCVAIVPVKSGRRVRRLRHRAGAILRRNHQHMANRIASSVPSGRGTCCTQGLSPLPTQWERQKSHSFCSVRVQGSFPPCAAVADQTRVITPVSRACGACRGSMGTIGSRKIRALAKSARLWCTAGQNPAGFGSWRSAIERRLWQVRL